MATQSAKGRGKTRNTNPTMGAAIMRATVRMFGKVQRIRNV